MKTGVPIHGLILRVDIQTYDQLREHVEDMAKAQLASHESVDLDEAHIEWRFCYYEIVLNDEGEEEGIEIGADHDDATTAVLNIEAPGKEDQ